MADEFVHVQIGQGTQVYNVVAKLIYDADGQPFALLHPDRVASLPEKVRLYKNKLKLIQAPSSGVPAHWDHQDVSVLG